MIRIIFTMIRAWWPGPLSSSKRWNVADPNQLRAAAFPKRTGRAEACRALWTKIDYKSGKFQIHTYIFSLGISDISPITAQQWPWPSCADHCENDPNHVVLPLMDLIILLHSKNVLWSSTSALFLGLLGTFEKSRQIDTFLATFGTYFAHYAQLQKKRHPC